MSVSHSGACMNNKDCEVNSSCYPPVVVWSSYFVQDIFEVLYYVDVNFYSWSLCFVSYGKIVGKSIGCSSFFFFYFI